MLGMIVVVPSINNVEEEKIALQGINGHYSMFYRILTIFR